jgi:hypothetical protein
MALLPRTNGEADIGISKNAFGSDEATEPRSDEGWRGSESPLMD